LPNFIAPNLALKRKKHVRSYEPGFAVRFSSDRACDESSGPAKMRDK
jgi:hypothetical protein